MFIDEVKITVKAGNGGKGAVMFYPMKKGPCGGPGGDGGSIFVRGDKQLADLHKYAGQAVYKAESGQPGQRFRKNGQSGEDLILRIPVGTLLKDKNSGREIEISDEETLHLLARGGRGGKGNVSFATSTNQVPRESEPGTPGEEVEFEVVMRLIADYGLVGLPNAGKSSLLNELTNAKVKTAMYAFTTLEPNLGVFNNLIIADIPGLIEGASQGKGLGFKFLKHVEKVPFILHCVGADSMDVLSDYETVNKELQAYNKKLLEKPKIILLTKSDLVSEDVLNEKIKALKKTGVSVIPISLYHPDQFQALKDFLLKMKK
jgi:GTP-binding protein